MHMIDTVRTGARWALAWLFLFAGQDVLRHPERPAAVAGPLLAAVRGRVPVELPDDETLVRANAATQLGAGAVLASGIATRPAAVVLAASLAPTTLAGHAFWKQTDPALRTNQRNHFNKNLALIGALLLLGFHRKDNRRASAQ